MSRLISYGLGLFLPFFFVAVAEKYFSESDIPELGYIDTSIGPCDNFYKFTCGHFQNFHPRPANVNILDHFSLLEDDLIRIGREILESPQQPDDPVALNKAKLAYKGCNEDYNGTEVPELRTVAEFGGMPLLSPSNEFVNFSWNEIGELVGKYGIPLIFSFTVVQTSQNETVIWQDFDLLKNPSMLRPSFRKTYDQVLEESFKEAARTRKRRSADQPAAFDVFLQTLAKKLLKITYPSKPDNEIVAELDDMADFMRLLYAAAINDDVGILTIEELQIWTDSKFDGQSDLSWIEYLNQVFQMAGIKITGDMRLYHRGLTYTYNVINLVRQTDPKILKNFALLRIFFFQAPDSDMVSRKAFEDYFNAKGYQLYPRWEYCTRKILDVVETASLSFAVTYGYQRYYYNINKISQATKLVQDIQAAFQDSLLESSWMDSLSRQVALQKARNMLVLLAYPNFVADKNKLDQFYENVEFCEWDNYGNARNIRAFQQAYQFELLDNPDRTFWGKSTFETDAYYNRPSNKIVIPIAMLNPVFFYGDNLILDYSRLGSIIGHEITHGFDLNGKNYDQDGIARSWWTDGTMEAFTESADCFRRQYNAYNVAEINTYVDGSATINENLADNGGVRQAFRAFKGAVGKEEIRATGNYSLEQLFFIGFGTMWCSAESDYYLTVIADAYSPNRYRVIGSLSNMREFAEAFDCPIGSNMNPENNCLLW